MVQGKQISSPVSSAFASPKYSARLPDTSSWPATGAPWPISQSELDSYVPERPSLLGHGYSPPFMPACPLETKGGQQRWKYLFTKRMCKKQHLAAGEIAVVCKSDPLEGDAQTESKKGLAPSTSVVHMSIQGRERYHRCGVFHVFIYILEETE